MRKIAVILLLVGTNARNRKRPEFARMQILRQDGKVAEMFDELIEGVVGEE